MSAEAKRQHIAYQNIFTFTSSLRPSPRSSPLHIPPTCITNNPLLVASLLAPPPPTVFDIDLTDYDGVRTCCSGANICRKCWKYMNMAVKVMNEGLSKDFGFKNMVWFYSGRRGVHCWVCDESARELSNDARSAVATYFELPLENEHKSMELSPSMHPMLTRAFRVLEPQFISDIIGDNGMGILTSQKSWVKLLKTLPEVFRASTGIAAELDREWSKATCTKTPGEKWAQLKSKINQATRKQQGKSQANNDSKTSESAEVRLD